MLIDYDIEDNPLQILTDSVIGGGDLLLVGFYTEDTDSSGDMWVKFLDPLQYWIGYCTTNDWVTFTAPEEQVRTWTITKTDTSVILTCNGVEIVNYLFSESTRDNCVSRWSNDAAKIKFIANSNGIDTASDEYRTKPIGKIRTAYNLRYPIVTLTEIWIYWKLR